MIAPPSIYLAAFLGLIQKKIVTTSLESVKES
jgi:hypothetical protein